MNRVHIASMALCIAAILGASPGSSEQSVPEVTKVPTTGDMAPDFALDDFLGKRFVLSESSDHGGVLLWFTNLCEGCSSKFGEMEKFKKAYAGKGVEVVAVSQLGKDRKTVETAIRASHLSMRFLYDPSGEITARYSGRYVAGTCPLTNIYIIDRDGKITYATHYPGVPEAEIANRLAQLEGMAEKGTK